MSQSIPPMVFRIIPLADVPDDFEDEEPEIPKKRLQGERGEHSA